MPKHIMVQGEILEHWAEHICEIGSRLFPEWEWLTFTTDAYQDLIRDWEGCAVKARLVRENPEFQYGMEKHGIIFEFHARDLECLPLASSERDLMLERIIRNGIDNYTLRIAPGARYPVYYTGYSEFFAADKGESANA